ncbi:putative UPF0481 protein [Acorus calamus]|uniref:UPF0481 protein n=1 Tax=Acorus calamus TaxID=4465 RepID=A0AAV9BYK7_ACOCL|nr:putative UPF0481 protein [Acorus calamus]
MPNATELQKAGVKFTPKENCSFPDVSFNNGVMKIPTFYVSEHTLPILRNLIAFEQCYPSTGRYFTFYDDLMDSLVDTPKDVKVLQQAGILEIGLSNQKEVAQLFNQLCKDVYYYKGTSYLNMVYSDVNYYCDSKWNRWKAFPKRNYFRNPWTITSVVAATTLDLTELPKQAQ